ncbi:hypothetical protein CF326_g5419 [Tilletia indica]|nr:hypothetical protein CF326_g5419 [Tilletia indica]
MQLVFSTLLTALFTTVLVTANIPQSSTEAKANDALAPRFPPTLTNSEYRAKPPVFLTHRSLLRDIDYLQELSHRDIVAPNEGEPQQHTDTGLDSQNAPHEGEPQQHTDTGLGPENTLHEGELQQHTDSGLDPEKEAVLRQVLMGFEADLGRIQEVISKPGVTKKEKHDALRIFKAHLQDDKAKILALVKGMTSKPKSNPKTRRSGLARRHSDLTILLLDVFKKVRTLADSLADSFDEALSSIALILLALITFVG